jgi:hypothetical protein
VSSNLPISLEALNTGGGPSFSTGAELRVNMEQLSHLIETRYGASFFTVNEHLEAARVAFGNGNIPLGLEHYDQGSRLFNEAFGSLEEMFSLAQGGQRWERAPLPSLNGGTVGNLILEIRELENEIVENG